MTEPVLSLLTRPRVGTQTAPQRPPAPRAAMNSTRNLDLYALECFDMLMRERSVSRAAERMDISQSSMSEALARLRERLGDPVLVRTRDGMVPTERAQTLLPHVRSAIDQLRAQAAAAAAEAARGLIAAQHSADADSKLVNDAIAGI